MDSGASVLRWMSFTGLRSKGTDGGFEPRSRNAGLAGLLAMALVFRFSVAPEAMS